MPRMSTYPLSTPIVGDETVLGLKPSGSSSDDETVLMSMDDIATYILAQDSNSGGGAGDVTAAATISDNVVVRGDGGVKGIQGSGVTLDDSNNITGVAALSATTIELGHASNTTISRPGAGDIAIEGNVVYRAGGTDVALADGGTGASLTDPNADRVLFWDDSAGAVTWLTMGTNLTITGTTLDASGGGGGGTIGKHMLPVMAVAMYPGGLSPCGTLAQQAGASGQPDVAYMPFDATSIEYAQFAIPMPESWDEGTITFKPIWKHPATATNFGVVWFLQAVAFSDDDAMATNFGTAQSSTDTGGTTLDQYIGPESSAITIAGTPAAGDTVFFRVYRDPTNGSDTMTVDAHLIGIRLYYTTAAETD